VGLCQDFWSFFEFTVFLFLLQPNGLICNHFYAKFLVKFCIFSSFDARLNELTFCTFCKRLTCLFLFFSSYLISLLKYRLQTVEVLFQSLSGYQAVK